MTRRAVPAWKRWTLALLGLVAGGASAVPPQPVDPPPLPAVEGQCVVLLHGLGRTHRSLARLEAALRQAGYATANIDYPSQSQTIEASAREAVPRGVRECRQAGARTIHFVTHARIDGLGRVVMLGPPNQGSEVADALVGTALYDHFNGPAGAQLVTGADGIAARLGPVDFPLGVIAGNEATAIDSLLATRIPGENDGKVAVGRARVDGMHDFLVLPVNHTFMMVNDVVIGQTLQFLRHGAFLHEVEPLAAP
ncbi:MAG: hypothetical protein J7507_09170 [Pseudoxanthomonas sp.]|nr:hypothetical protein [Pseudoxanthomonas sp.]